MLILKLMMALAVVLGFMVLLVLALIAQLAGSCALDCLGCVGFGTKLGIGRCVA